MKRTIERHKGKLGEGVHLRGCQICPSGEGEQAVKTCIYIPTWNVHKWVPGVLENIPVTLGRNCAEIFVLDNASTDGTVEAVCTRIKKGLPFPVHVYRNKVNRGYGGSQKAAYAHALRHGYDAVVMLHGDSQYSPHFVSQLLEELQQPNTGMAYGTRYLPCEGAPPDETPLIRRLGIRGLSALQNLCSGMGLIEWYSGFRAFRCDALRQIPFQACNDDYYFEVQITLLLGMLGCRIAEVPIIKRYEGIKSAFNIYQFTRKSLAHMLHFPLARAGLISGPLYQFRYWDQLRATPVPEPIPVLVSEPGADCCAA